MKFVTLYSQSILEELEKERERRWKAEQAAKKLVDHIQTLTNKGIFLINLSSKKAEKSTVELQWLKHHCNHENMFETGVVQANGC